MTTTHTETATAPIYVTTVTTTAFDGLDVWRVLLGFTLYQRVTNRVHADGGENICSVDSQYDEWIPPAWLARICRIFRRRRPQDSCAMAPR